MKKVISLVVMAGLWSGPLLAQTVPNQKTSSEVYSDWELLCIEQSDRKACAAKHTIANDQQALVSVIEVAKTDVGNLVMQFAVPHMLDLEGTPKIVIDQNDEFDAPYKFCNQQACFMLVDNPAIFEAFSEGSAGVISAPTLNGSTFEIGFSLLGFSAAFKSLTAQQ